MPVPKTLYQEPGTDSDSEFAAPTKRWKASTPELEVTMKPPSPTSSNLSFESTVFEFPINGTCVYRTIEIGLSGEEQQISSESDSEPNFPAKIK